MSTIESTPKADLAYNVASGQAVPASPFVEGFEQWVKDFNKYETMLVRSRPSQQSAQC